MRSAGGAGGSGGTPMKRARPPALFPPWVCCKAAPLLDGAEVPRAAPRAAPLGKQVVMGQLLLQGVIGEAGPKLQHTDGRQSHGTRFRGSHPVLTATAAKVAAGPP